MAAAYSMQPPPPPAMHPPMPNYRHGGSGQIPNHQQGGTFQIPNHQQSGTMQMPSNQQGATFQMPNHQQGGTVQGQHQQIFAPGPQQTRAGHNVSHGPQLEQYDNPNPSGGGQRNQVQILGRPADIPTLYEGWTFRKAPVAPGEKSTWLAITSTQLPYDRAELIRLVKKIGSKSTVDKQLGGLKSDMQREHIDRLLEEKRLGERDQNVEWVVACVKPTILRTQTNQGLREETSKIQVVLKRQARQERTVGRKLSKKGKSATVILDQPGQRVDLRDRPMFQPGMATMKTTGRAGQPSANQQHEFNGQTHGPVHGGVATHGGLHAPQSGHGNGPRAPMPVQQPQNVQRMSQEPPSMAFANEGRAMHKNNDHQGDIYDESIPIQLVEGPRQQIHKQPPVPQMQQSRGHGFAAGNRGEASGAFREHEQHRGMPQHHKTKMPTGFPDKRSSSPIQILGGDYESSEESWSRDSFDSMDRHSPVSLPTTVSGGSPSHKRGRHSGQDLLDAPRRHPSHAGYHSRHTPRSSRDSTESYDIIGDMIPNRHNTRRESSRYPHRLPPRPSYKDRAMTSPQLARTLNRLEEMRLDEMDELDQLEREQRAYEKEERMTKRERAAVRDREFGRRDERFDRGFYR